jgi:preprotein translocase subunit SecD
MSQESSFPPPPPPYGGTAQYGPPKRGRGPLVLVGVLGLVLIVVIALGAFVLLRNDDSQPAESKAPARAPESVQFRGVVKTEPNGCGGSTPATPPTADGTACDSDGIRYTLGKVELDGRHVSEVKADTGTDLSWIINLTLDDEGARLFRQLTTGLATKTPPQNQLAIVVEGRVVTAPTVMSPITDGKVQITGRFNQADAEKLVKEITG